MTRLECPDCHNQAFNIQIAPGFTPKGLEFLYVICVKCGKLWRMRVITINEGYISRAELKPMVEK